MKSKQTMIEGMKQKKHKIFNDEVMRIKMKDESEVRGFLSQLGFTCKKWFRVELGVPTLERIKPLLKAQIQEEILDFVL